MASLFTSPSLAQPRREGPPPTQAESAERMRNRVEERLEEIRKEATILEEALRAIDEGEPPMRVLRDLVREERDQGVGRFGDRDDEREIDIADLTPERRAEILNFVKEMTPTLGERIERDLRDNPERADMIYMRLAPRVLPQIELRERDPELFDIRAESMRLDWQIRGAAIGMRRAEGEEAGPARERLKSLIGQRVDLTMKERALMIDRFEQRIATMREELAKERERRDAIVEEKVADIERGEMRGPEGERRGGPPGRRDDGPDRRDRRGPDRTP